MLPESKPNHSQCEIINNFNNFFKKNNRIPHRLNRAGICFALALSFLRENISVYHQIDNQKWFQKFLYLGADPLKIESFYEAFDKALAEYGALEEKDKLSYQKNILEPYYDVLSVIDQALLIYASTGKGYFLPHIQPNMDPRVLFALNMQYLDSLYIVLKRDDFESFFSLNSSISPFEKGGHYLLTFSDHAVGIDIDDAGNIAYYDPNQESILQSSEALHSEKASFFEWYQDSDKPDQVAITVFAVDHIGKDFFEKSKKIRSKIGLAAKHILDLAWDRSDLFLGSLQNGVVRMLYYCQSPLLEDDRSLWRQSVATQAQKNKINPSSLLKESVCTPSDLSVMMELIVVTHKTGSEKGISDIMSLFDSESSFSDENLSVAIYLDNPSLFDTLLDHISSDFVWTSSILDQADRTLNQKKAEVSSKIINDLIGGRKIENHSGHFLIYLIEHRYDALAVKFLSEYSFADLSQTDQENFLDIAITDNLKQLFFLAAQQNCSYVVMKALIKHDCVDWLEELLSAEKLHWSLNSSQWQELLEYAFYKESIELVNMVLSKEYKNVYLSNSMLSDLTTSFRAGRIYFFDQLFRHNIVSKLIQNDSHTERELRTQVIWMEALSSLCGFSEKKDDQRILTTGIQRSIESANYNFLRHFLSIPGLIFKPQDIVFKSKSLLVHLIEAEEWSLVFNLLNRIDNKAIDPIARKMIMKNLSIIILDTSLTSVELELLLDRLTVSVEDFFQSGGREVRLLEKYHPQVFHAIFKKIGDSDRQHTIDYLNHLFMKNRSILVSKNAKPEQLRQALKQIKYILKIMELLMDGSVDGSTRYYSIIKQWNQYLNQGIPTLVREWQMRKKDYQVKELLSWKGIGINKTADINEHSFYRRVLKFFSGCA